MTRRYVNLAPTERARRFQLGLTGMRVSSVNGIHGMSGGAK